MKLATFLIAILASVFVLACPPSTPEARALDQSGKMEDQACAQLVAQPQCQALYAKIKEAGNDPEEYKPDCKPQSYTDHLLQATRVDKNCAFGALKSVGDMIGDGIGWVMTRDIRRDIKAQCNASPGAKRQLYYEANANNPVLLHLPIPTEAQVANKTCEEISETDLPNALEAKAKSLMAQIQQHEQTHQTLTPDEAALKNWYRNQHLSLLEKAGRAKDAIDQYLDEKNIALGCYNLEKRAEITCGATSDIVQLATGAGALVKGGIALKAAGLAWQTARVAKNSAKAAEAVEAAAKDGAEVAKTAGTPPPSTPPPVTATGGKAATAKPTNASSTQVGAAASEVANTVPTTTRSQFVADYGKRALTTPEQNKQFILLAEQPEQPGQRIFVTVEHSALKRINDASKDRDLNTAITNKHLELFQNEMEALIKRNPGLKLVEASGKNPLEIAGQNVDFKSANFAIEGHPLPANLAQQLEQAQAKVNKEFTAFVKKNQFFTDQGDPSKWFRSGTGNSADKASLAARYSRQVEGENTLQHFANPELQQKLEAQLVSVEKQRASLQSSLGKTPFMEATPDGAKMIPVREVFEVTRKESDPAVVAKMLSTQFNSPMSIEEAHHLVQYTKDLDAFSPANRFVKREVATLGDETAAQGGGITTDKRGLGAQNYYDLAAKLPSHNLNDAIVKAREAEKITTKTFVQETNQYRSAIANYGTKKGLSDLKVTCSGDDCVAISSKAWSAKDKEEIVKRLSRTDNPAGVRVSFVQSGIENAEVRAQLGTHGEAIEKALRKELMGQLPVEKLNKVVFGVEMQGRSLGQGGVRLLIGNAQKQGQLSQEELKVIDQAFKKAVEDVNKGLRRKSDGPLPAEYRPTYQYPPNLGYAPATDSPAIAYLGLKRSMDLA